MINRRRRFPSYPAFCTSKRSRNNQRAKDPYPLHNLHSVERASQLRLPTKQKLDEITAATQSICTLDIMNRRRRSFHGQFLRVSINGLYNSSKGHVSELITTYTYFTNPATNLPTTRAPRQSRFDQSRALN